MTALLFVVLKKKLKQLEAFYFQVRLLKNLLKVKSLQLVMVKSLTMAYAR
ncbi:Uncharacterised protein [Mycobacteroides abscessus]|nr:Uncharacterised protein [Mycobacteroides abscessus]